MKDDTDHPEFDAEGKWPRRLLHIWLMTSFKWEPGNKYGGISNPTYAVLSYTWGRWRINDPEWAVTVDVLPVRGIPWQVPAVDPKHFTASGFRNILEAMVSQQWGRNKSQPPSPFVWVDIACIPQFSASAVAHSEIGRQARIFRGAANGSIWLTTVEPRYLAEGLFEKDLTDDSRDPVKDMKDLCQIFTDPWFSSLWTLQESFILGEKVTYIIGHDGFCFIPDTEEPLQWFYFRAVASNYNSTYESHPGGSITSNFDKVPAGDGEKERYLAMWNETWLRSGLSSEIDGSPMEALAGSSFRKTERENDRIYGIMQVFGDEYRVGKSRLSNTSSTADDTFTLLELEDELGTLLVTKLPTTCQLFVHDEPPLYGRAWRICGKAFVPHQIADQHPECIKRRLDCCKISPRVLEEGTMWASFESRSCRLETVVNAMRSVSHALNWGYVNSFLDSQSNTTTTHGSSLSRTRYQLENVDLVLEHFGRDALTIVLLSIQARNEDHFRDYTLYGLLLLRPGNEAVASHKSRRGWHPGIKAENLQNWARVGICEIRWCEHKDGIWTLGEHSFFKGDLIKSKDKHDFLIGMEIDILLGISNEWRDEQGLFG